MELDKSHVKIFFSLVILLQLGGLISLALGMWEVNRPTEISNTLVSSLLATITAYLLYTQTDLQKQLLDLENKMLKHETQPALEVVDKRYRNDDVILDIANYGNGIAQNLVLVCEVVPEDVEWYNGVPSRTSLKEYHEDEDYTLDTSSILPQETPETFLAESVTVSRIPSGETEPVEAGFSSRMAELRNEDESDVTIRFEVHAESKVGQEEILTDIGEPITLSMSDIPESPTISSVYKYQQ